VYNSFVPNVTQATTDLKTTAGKKVTGDFELSKLYADEILSDCFGTLVRPH